MKFRVEVSAQAETDASEILSWLLSEGAGETGIRWFLGLEDAITSLETFPKACSLAPETSRFRFESPPTPLRSQTSCLPNSVHD